MSPAQFLSPANRDADAGRQCAAVRFSGGSLCSRPRGAGRGWQGEDRRSGWIDQAARRGHGDRRARQDAAARPVGFAPARWRRRLEPAAECRNRHHQLSQSRIDDRRIAEHLQAPRRGRAARARWQGCGDHRPQGSAGSTGRADRDAPPKRPLPLSARSKRPGCGVRNSTPR